MKGVFVISPITEGLTLETRWDGAERRRNQRRMGIGRRTGDHRRKASARESSVDDNRRRAPERRGAADRRRRPDRRIGLGRALDLSDLGL